VVWPRRQRNGHAFRGGWQAGPNARSRRRKTPTPGMAARAVLVARGAPYAFQGFIRVEQGKGGKDHRVMLSPRLLDLVRAGGRGAPARLAVPGPRAGAAHDHAPAQSPCHAAAQMAEFNKRVSLHTLRHSFAIHLRCMSTQIPVLPKRSRHARSRATCVPQGTGRRRCHLQNQQREIVHGSCACVLVAKSRKALRTPVLTTYWS
jgi:integrase